jgi:hypothetical protein
MVRIVVRLAVLPRNRAAVMQNARELVRFFEQHGVRSEGVFESFNESEIIHVWAVPSIQAYEDATVRIRNDPAFREFAARAGELVVNEKREYWRAVPQA